MNRSLRSQHARLWPAIVLLALAGLALALMIKPPPPVQPLEPLEGKP